MELHVFKTGKRSIDADINQWLTYSGLCLKSFFVMSSMF